MIRMYFVSTTLFLLTIARVCIVLRVEPYRLSTAPVNESRRVYQPEPKWQRVDTKDQDFSILMPVQPDVYTRPGGFSFKPDGEIIKKVLRGLAYKSGVFYSVEIYETSAPKVALQELMRGTDHSKASRRELIVNGYKGREYTYTGESSYTVYQYFATNKRFYVIKAVSRRGGNSALRYFLNSLRLGNAEPSADNPVPPDVENAINDYAPQQPADIYLPEEVEIKAMIVWTPDTIYAKFFPLKKLTDPVKVSMILTSTGEVIDVKVISGAKGDSSGMVAEAIKATKFLPAEKKGHPVSERVVLSLDFGL